MTKEKACKQCKTIYAGIKCPNCDSTESGNFKGEVVILNSENSEIAKNLKVEKKGKYALRLG